MNSIININYRENIWKKIGLHALLFILLFLLTEPLSQAQHINWARHFGSSLSSDYEYPMRVTATPDGGYILAGMFMGCDVDFDPSGSTTVHRSSNDCLNQTNHDIFFSKFDRDGNFQWVNTITGSGYEDVNDVAVDPGGNIFLTGTFSSSDVDFDPQGGMSPTFTLMGANDTFIAKYAADGTFIRVIRLGSGGSDQVIGSGVHVDQNNDLLVTGRYGGTVNFDPATGEWTWRSGSDTEDQVGIYGIKGTPDPANIPGARLSSISWTDSLGNIWLFGGGGYDSNGTYGKLNDLWRYDPASGEWTWMAGSDIVDQQGIYGTKGTGSTANIPGARHGSISWIDAEGKLWLFGGEGFDNDGSSGYLNDLWRYDPASGEWTWMAGSDTSDQAGTYGTKGAGSTTNIAGARFRSISWMDDTGNLWLFGGHGLDGSGASGNLNDLWRYDPATGEWTWMAGSHVIGAQGTYGTFGIGSTTNIPGARNGSISWMDDTGNLWLFGGYGRDGSNTPGRLNDLWRYEPATEEWTWVGGSDMVDQQGTYGTMGAGSTTNIAGARNGSISWMDDTGNLWLFGGHGLDGSGSSGFLNDLWRYDPATGEWTWMAGSDVVHQPGEYGTKGAGSTANIPGARDLSISWKGETGNFWLFGGYGYDGSGSLGHLNDLWQHNLSYSLTSQSSSEDIYYAKYTSDLELVWAKSVGGTDTDVSNFITSDLDNNIYITGSFGASMDFDPGEGTQTLTSNGDRDAFLAKYTTDGDYLNAFNVGGTLMEDAFYVDFDNNNNVYWSGFFESTNVDFDPGTGSTTLSSSGMADIFVSKYEASGTHIWAHCIGGSDFEGGAALVDRVSNRLYLAGQFASTSIDCDVSASDALLNNNGSTGSTDVFFAQYDLDFNHIWSRNIGNETDDELNWGCLSYSYNPPGNFILTGIFGDDTYPTVDFDPSAQTYTMTSNGGNDVYIASYSTPMSGNYTIGPSNADFPDFNSAVDALTTNGINGPVYFDVQAGTYNEQIVIPYINGVTSVNTIHFRSESYDSTSVVVSWAGGELNNYVLLLDGTENIQFSHMTFENTSSSYGTVIEIRPVSDSLYFYNNVITSVSTTDDLVVRDQFANYDGYAHFELNALDGGFTGIYCYETTDLYLIDNTFIDQSRAAIETYMVMKPRIIGNTITSTSTTYMGAMNIVNTTNDAGEPGYPVISKNRISVPGYINTSTVELNNASCDETVQAGSIINNFIHMNIKEDSCAVLSLYNSSDINIFHNSINISGEKHPSTAFLLETNDGIDYKNNIFSNQAGSVAACIETDNTNITGDYNVLYTSGDTLALYGTTYCADLAAWQSASSLDANSMSFDPAFVSNSDLHTFKGSLIAGISTWVADDIDDELRDATTPCIGADEFNPTISDSLALVAIYNSLGGSDWTDNTNWLTGNLDTWSGIYMADGRVTHIDLSNNNLIGSLPQELGNLTQLKSFNMSTNQITGEIPAGLWQLDSLINISLFLNDLSGTLPEAIGNLTKLESFDIGDNNFTGTLPDTLSSLDSLSLLAMGNNDLTDTIPPLSNALTELLVDGNHFTHISDLTGNSNLSIFNAQSNAFDFGDLEPYTSVSSFSYAPQDSLGLARTDSVDLYASFTLTIDAGGTNTQYQWHRDGNPITGATSATYTDPQCTSDDYGDYHCVCTNSDLPDLTLYSRPVTVVPSGDTAAVTTTDYLIAQDGSGDFLSFNEAVTFLVNHGVSGRVNMNVADGTYNEQVLIPPITGTSEVNRVTFQSVSGDSTAVVLTWSADSTDNYTLKLDNDAKYFTFRDLTLQAEDTAYGRVLDMRWCSNHYFHNNRFSGVINDNTNDSDLSTTVVNGDNIDSVSFENNFIENGSHGIHINEGIRNVISKNIFNNQRFKSLQVTNQEGILIVGNSIDHNESPYAIVVDANYSIIINNVIKSQNSDYARGIFISGDGLDESGEYPVKGHLANNFIYLNSSQNRGIRADELNDYGIYHNTVYISNTSSTDNVYCLDLSNTCSAIDISNNIFANDSDGGAPYLFHTTTGFTSDFNDLYSSGAVAAYLDSNGDQTDFDDLAAWQSFSGGDANSISVKPNFETEGDFRILNPEMDNAGTPIAEVITDIEGDPRDATAPDMGADEYTAPSLPDLIVANQYADPSTIYTGFPFDMIGEVQNLGANMRGTQTDIRIYLSSNTSYEAGDDSLLVTLPFDSIDAGQRFTFNESYSFDSDYTPGDYNLLFIADQDNIITEQSENNNTAYFAIVLAEPDKPDLEASSVNVTPDPVNGYQDFNVTFVVDNYGSEDMSTTTSMEIFLSTDETADSEDFLLATLTIDPIAAYSSASFDESLTLPEGVAEGAYYILIVLDTDFLVDELYEDNNLFVYAIDIVYVDTQAPQIAIIDNIEHYNASQGNVTCRIKVTEDAGLYRVFFWHKGIMQSSDQWQRRDMFHVQGDTFKIDIESSFMDLMGMEHAFSAYDHSGKKDSTELKYIYNSFGQGGVPSQNVHKGDQQTDYRIISIPLQLDNMSVAGIFADDFGTYDKSKWRIFRLTGTTYSEMGSGSVQLGKGYWLINNVATSFNVGAGSTPHYNQGNPFKMQLSAGWNMIGNPYPFAISWNTVLQHNGIDSGVGNLKFYNGATYSENDLLSPFTGAFVSSQNDVTLEIPLVPSGSGTRIAASELDRIADNTPDEEAWFIGLELSSGTLSNHFGGIGMHPEAREGVDKFDDFTIPPFMAYLDLNHKKGSFHGSPVTRSIVNVQNEYIWDFEVASSLTGEMITISWDNEWFSKDNSSLILFDMNRKTRIDMKKQNEYVFTDRGANEFRILYSKDGFNETSTFSAYPNPFYSELIIPVFVTEDMEHKELKITINNLSGQVVKDFIIKDPVGGYMEYRWTGLSSAGDAVPPGIYFINIESSPESDKAIRHFKVIKK